MRLDFRTSITLGTAMTGGNRHRLALYQRPRRWLSLLCVVAFLVVELAHVGHAVGDMNTAGHAVVTNLSADDQESSAKERTGGESCHWCCTVIGLPVAMAALHLDDTQALPAAGLASMVSRSPPATSPPPKSLPSD
ncbi:MAG TPA: hypothetical protein VJ890_26630 [Vineibacter sp.]|nr:hypothetical protein [Vineibacter sp.]